MSVPALARFNGLAVNAPIQAGQQLRIPPAEVESGLRLPPLRQGLDEPTERPLDEVAPGLVKYLESRRGVSAAAVYEPATDTLFTHNPDRRFAMASTVKLPIMVTQLARQVARNSNATGPGTELLRPMITVSGNEAATELLAQVGGPPAVEAELRARGIRRTDVSEEAWGLSTTTAPDMALLMRSLWHGERLNERLRGVAIGLMSEIVAEQRWGVPAGLPASAEVAFKGGWLPVRGGWLVHQVGAAQLGGGTYIFAFYNSEQATWDFGKETLRRSAQLLSERSRRR